MSPRHIHMTQKEADRFMGLDMEHAHPLGSSRRKPEGSAQTRSNDRAQGAASGAGGEGHGVAACAWLPTRVL